MFTFVDAFIVLKYIHLYIYLFKTIHVATGVGESNPTPYTEVLKRNQLDGYRGELS